MKIKLWTLIASCCAISIAPSAVCAVQLTSADFNFAFGANEGNGSGGNNNANPWSKSENPETNSPETQGNFTMTAMPNGPAFTGTGPTFPGRVLTTGGAGNIVAWIGASDGTPGNTQPSFVVPIIGNYDGPAPADADPVAPNYRLTVEITDISIYVGAHPSSPMLSAAWTETTPGHPQAQSPVNLGAGSSDYANSAVYTKLSFDPIDYSMPLSGPNDWHWRRFDILPSDTSDLRYADGLEISGRVILTYNAVSAVSDADFDDDGNVDGDDLTRWRDGFGTGSTHMQGDADGDADVDGADFLTWQRQLGNSTALAAAKAVPEPSALVLVLLAGCGFALRGPRRRLAWRPPAV